MMSLRSNTAVLATVAIFCSYATANWPRFRGPNGSATAPAANVPVEWKPENILWKTPLEGQGISSPCIWGDRLFITTALKNGKVRMLLCYDTRTGKERWRRPVDFDYHKKHDKNSYATATPVTDGRHVFAAFGSPDRFMVQCFDMDGTTVWEQDLGGFKSNHGPGASPILHKDRLIIATEDDAAASIAALDIRNHGKVLWRVPRGKFNTAYATPFVLTINGKEQVIISSTYGLSGIDFQTGKELWNCPLMVARSVSSPIAAGELVIAHCGQGGRGHKMVAVRPDGSGDVSKSHVAWQATQKLPYCTTPVVAGNLLFTVLDNGVARCLDAKTGADVWDQRLQGNFFSSPVCVGDRVFFINETGNVWVVAAEAKYRLLARNKLDDDIVTTPAIVGDRMYIRGAKFLWCVGNR